MEFLSNLYRTINEKTVPHRLYIIALTGGVVAAIILSPLFSSSVKLGHAENLAVSTREAATFSKEAFDDVLIQARAAYVLDLTTHEVLFQKNETEALPLASITKLMTALVAHESLTDDSMITITQDDLQAEGDIGLRPGERFKVENLLDVMLFVSSNDAAHAVARFVGMTDAPQGLLADEARTRFVERMNNQARSLGFSTLNFLNESGLDVRNNGVLSPGAVGSAYDVALLAERLWREYPTALAATTDLVMRITSEDGRISVLKNTNEALGRYPGMLGSKTGFTDLAGGNLVIIFDVGINHPIAAVVLGSTREGRFEDMVNLTQATLKTFE